MKRLSLALPSFVLLSFALTGCGGGGGGNAVPAGPSIPSKSAASAVFTITIPAKTPQYVSPNTQSVSITLLSVNGASVGGAPVIANVSATAPGCTSSGGTISCSIPVPAQAGTDVYAVTMFAGTNATGATLSSGQATANIVAGQLNTVPVTMNGVVSKVALSLGSPMTTGSVTKVPLIVTAQDPSGATIIGGAPFTQPITLTSNDTSGHTTVSPTSVPDANTGLSAVTVTYDGSPSVPATVTITAAGGGTTASVVYVPKGGAVVSKFITANAGGSLPLMGTNGGTYTFSVLPNALSADSTVTIAEVTQSALPAPLSSTRRPLFIGGAGNTYVYAFTVGLGGATLSTALTLSAANATNLPVGTTLNLAVLQGSTWVDVGTATVSAASTISLQAASSSLPSIKTPGTYLLYQPAAGTSTTVANYGVALIADDGSLSPNGLQIINLYDPNGNPLPTPVATTMPFNGYDLDGAALTPDGSQGVIVDGGNTLDFFSGVQIGKPVASMATVSTTAAGGDGDSVAILPNGDEAVVAADGSNLLVVSGILSGNPKPAIGVNTPGSRSALVISNDGKTLLAREGSNIDVFSIASISPAPGALGGMISHSFSLVQTLTANTAYADGRGGMAFSPADSTRAVAVGYGGSGPTLALITGLPGAPTLQSLQLRVPFSPGMLRRPSNEQRRSQSIGITGASGLNAVAISPDGKLAIIGTDAGIALVSGVDTGSLVQVGSIYAPSVNDANGTAGAFTRVSTLGITLDGKYVVAVGNVGSNYTGTLLLIPFSASGFATPKSQLNRVAYPYNDQILIH